MLAVLRGGMLGGVRGPTLTARLHVASWPSLSRLLTWTSITAASLYLVGFVIAGVLRLSYPYPLDRMEEAAVQVVRHMLSGQPAYGPPTLTYVPVVYPPLYFALAAAAGLVTGASLVPLRLVSLLGSVIAAALIFGLVRRETHSRTLGLVSAAVFVGSTHISLTSLDLGRVDALGVALMLGAIYAMRTADLQPGVAGRASAAAGALVGFAVITKQTNLILAVALLGYAALSPRIRLLPYGLALSASIGLPLLVVYAHVGDWLRVYLLELPSTHVLNDRHLDNFWVANIFPAFTLPLAIGPLFVVGRVVRDELRTALFYGGVSATLLFLAWGGWANLGAAQNVLEPAYAILAVMFGLGLWEARALLAERTPEHDFLRNYLLALCVVQFLILGYNPRTTVPLRSDGWASERLIGAIAALPGNVLAPDYGEWARAAGKGDQPATGAVLELTGAFASSGSVPGNQWRAEFEEALQTRLYDYVLWNPQSDAFVLKGLIENARYVNIGSLFKAQDEYNQWKTAATPDVDVYVPVERAPAPGG
jgi:4-amino-4-deoxy-L-arabinose transferase-like glycosyltransferase